MKPIKSLLILAVLAIVCVPMLASAQGYYRRGRGPGEPIPGGFHNRAGRLTFGFSVGLGGMSDNGSAISSCDNCDFNPLALEADVHIGGMLTPRFALMFEAQVNGQTIHSDRFNGDTTLTQGAAMIAGQFWIVPVLWIKGGLGFANLQIDDAFFTEDLGTGGALMGAVGLELLSARNFALELQGRIIGSTYNGGDDHLTSGTIGLGINWY
jgi:hypothetical protein